MNKKEVGELAQKIKQADPASLAKAITLVESRKYEHWQWAKELFTQLKGHGKKSFRLGISGPPGVGKSTFIEALGKEILKSGKSVAVLAIDPSSQVSGGSILGDKTRMEELSRSERAFVRPSPSRGHLGGVTLAMPGTLFLCEAAGFDWIIVETVGVGQSEGEVKNMVDHLAFIAQPGAGDELQGVKKGILEFVDTIVVNKADIDSSLARTSQQQYLAALKVMRGQSIPVFSCSALKSEGLEELKDHFQDQGISEERRSEQDVFWFQTLLQSQFLKFLESESSLEKPLAEKKRLVQEAKLLPIEAVDLYLKEILKPQS